MNRRYILLSAALVAFPAAAHAATVCDRLAQSNWRDPSGTLAILMLNGALAAVLVSGAVRRSRRAAEARWRSDISARVTQRLAEMRKSERETEEILKARIAAHEARRAAERDAKALIATMGAA